MSFARLAAPFMTIGLFVTAPAIAQTASAPAPAPPGVARLAQIPGVVVQYYDVSGITIEALRASIDAQRPKDPVTGHAIPAAAKWSIGTSVRRETTGTACKIIGATATFKGEVVMPRLATVEAVPAPVLAEWQRYVSSLEAQQVASFRPILERLSEVEKAVMASTCEGAAAAANKAIAEISKPPAPVPASAAPTN